jgi:polyphosphate glucokinase
VSAVSKDTLMMQQWRELKSQHAGAILLYRCGDFYEMFYEDAEVGARALGLTLTARHNGGAADVPLAGVPVRDLMTERLGLPVVIDNDANCALLAEHRAGAARGVRYALMLTLGTGIGSALFVGGRLVPNTEFGHIEMRGKDAEHRASDSARKREDLSWREYAERLDEYLHRVENLLWPDLIVVGGGISKKSEKFLPYLTSRTTVIPAQMLNEAGIAGAALAGISTEAALEAAE